MLCKCGHEERHHDNEASRCEVDGCGCAMFWEDTQTEVNTLAAEVDRLNNLVNYLSDAIKEERTRGKNRKDVNGILSRRNKKLEAEVARLQAQVEAMRGALLMVQCRLNTCPGGVVYFAGEEWAQIDAVLAGGE